MEVIKLNERLVTIILTYLAGLFASWVLKQFGIVIPMEVQLAAVGIVMVLIGRYSRNFFTKPEEKELFKQYQRDINTIHSAEK